MHNRRAPRHDYGLTAEVQRLLRFWAFFFCAMLLIGPAEAQKKTRRVLILYPYNNLYPVSVLAGEAVRKGLLAGSPDSLELYTDFLDLGRFSGQEYERRAASYLAEKYRERAPEVVIALGPQALRFVLRNRAELNFRAPLVFCCTSRSRLATLNPAEPITGIISEFDVSKTLTLGRQLQPRARAIAVVAGATEFDREWIGVARRQLAPYEQQFAIRYVYDLRYQELVHELERLPRDTIVILLTMFADRDGQRFITPEIVPELTKASAAPVYSPYETYAGLGVVGGYVDSIDKAGDEVADLALALLSGKNTSEIQPRTSSGGAYMVDWRALKRWDLSETTLPAGSKVLFREFTFWETYRTEIIAVLALITAQAALIFWLLIERKRRHHAELELRRRLMEVIHLNRTAVAGALSASFAHELNQPLGAILSNSQTAELLLAKAAPDISQLKEILADIRRDDLRAGNIIANLRSLMRRTRDSELRNLDLNDAVKDAVHLLDAEAAARGVNFKQSYAEGVLSVRADEVNLQQVVINLAMNGMDAMGGAPPGTRRMELETSISKSEAIVSIADSGSGIPQDKLIQVFETFFTTKSEGTGLGLSIARTIIETYGGKIWAENRRGGGAVFSFTLPLAM
jgi:signal transduction histidine kinase